MIDIVNLHLSEVSQVEGFRLLRTEKCCKDKTVPKVCLGLCKSQIDNSGNRIGKSVLEFPIWVAAQNTWKQFKVVKTKVSMKLH